MVLHDLGFLLLRVFYHDLPFSSIGKKKLFNKNGIFGFSSVVVRVAHASIGQLVVQVVKAHLAVVLTKNALAVTRNNGQRGKGGP